MTIRPPERGRAEARELAAYLAREQAAQPLHNRLMLLWASAAFPEALPEAARRALVDEVWKRQQADGSWKMDALGPFQAHAHAPRSEGGSAYATAFAAYVMLQSGDAANPKMARALAWLRAHQDPECGCWPAVSMNEPYAPGSIPSGFMTDAATSFAVLALLDSHKNASAGPPPAY